MIPFEPGKCVNTPIKELDGLRVIDAKFERGFMMVIAEKDSKYNRYIFCFNETMSSYTCGVQNDVQDVTVNFTSLSNGICVHMVDDDTVEVFMTNEKVKEVKSSDHYRCSSYA